MCCSDQNVGLDLDKTMFQRSKSAFRCSNATSEKVKRFFRES